MFINFDFKMKKILNKTATNLIFVYFHHSLLRNFNHIPQYILKSFLLQYAYLKIYEDSYYALLNLSAYCSKKGLIIGKSKDECINN